MASRSTPSTPQRARDWRPAFLAAFRNSANVRASAQAAGVDWSTAYKARKREPRFADAWEMAEQEALDLLEARAMQLAMAGDAHLLIFLLKARRPATYRDNARLELTGAAGGPIQTQPVLAGMDDHERAALRRLMDEVLEGEPA
jgi:hypothetical protein